MREKWMHIKACFFIIFGVIAAGIQLLATILEIIEEAEGIHEDVGDKYD